MKRLASLITAFALALQASGSAFAISHRLIETDYDTGSMTDVTFDYDHADRMIEMVDDTGTTEWTYVDGDLTSMISPQGTILYVYRPNTGRLQDVIESVAGPDIATHYVYDDAGQVETVSKFGETTTFQYDDASRPVR